MESGSVQVTSRPDAAAVLRRWLTRPLVAGLLLLLVYVGLSFVNDPRGYLGTDTGGKTATLKVMAERGDFDPDVGYWAEQWDPAGRVHGLFFTSKVGDRYLNVTTLPMVFAAEPLWRVGGYRMALLLPMAGAVAAAFAARALARRMGSGSGWPAFWLVGLASPVVIYALDFWEHTPGLALMAWGVVALVDAVERRPTWWRGLLAGVAFGAAFSMRNEAAAYAVAAVAVACVTLLLARRDLRGALVTGATAVVGLALMFVANAGLETAVLGSTIRSARATGAVAGGGTSPSLRATEALITSLSPFNSDERSGYVMAVGMAVALAYVVWGSWRKRDRRLVVAAAVLVVLVYLFRFSQGVGFVPGLVATTPVAMAGLVLGWRDQRSRLVVLMAIAPLPLVFLFEFPGGAIPQWAGRYILLSGLLLAVAGMARIRLVEPWVRTLLVVLSVAVTVFGVGWLSVRSHAVARVADRLESRPEPVLISPDGFVPREFGGSYGRKNWLASGNADDERFAAQVALESGADSFALVQLNGTTDVPTFDGWQAGDSEVVPFVSGTMFRVTTYTRTAPA